MNLYRGFQRMYAVATVLWVALMLISTPSNRLKFWVPDIDYDALAEKASHIDYGAHVEVPTPPPGYKLDPPPEPPPGAVLIQPKPTATRLEKTLWLFEILVLPPVLGYLALFLVVPWIYRGFRTSKPA